MKVTKQMTTPILRNPAGKRRPGGYLQKSGNFGIKQVDKNQIFSVKGQQIKADVSEQAIDKVRWNDFGVSKKHRLRVVTNKSLSHVAKTSK